MSNQTSQILVASELNTALSSRQLLAVGEHKRSGLIICKAHHAEFAGPGAAVGTLIEPDCISVIAIGAPEIMPVITPKQRQTAYSRRIQWIRWLQKITEHPDAMQRAEKLFASFEEFFGAQALMGLSDEVLALLIGVMPSTVATVRSHHQVPQLLDLPALAASSEPLKFSSVRLNMRSSYTSSKASPKPCASFLAALYSVPICDCPS